MLKKTTWIVVLLVALLALSATAAWARGINRAADVSLVPSGSAALTKVEGMGSGRQPVAPKTLKTERHGHCHLDEASAEAAW